MGRSLIQNMAILGVAVASSYFLGNLIGKTSESYSKGLANGRAEMRRDFEHAFRLSEIKGYDKARFKGEVEFATNYGAAADFAMFPDEWVIPRAEAARKRGLDYDDVYFNETIRSLERLEINGLYDRTKGPQNPQER